MKCTLSQHTLYIHTYMFYFVEIVRDNIVEEAHLVYDPNEEH